MRGLFYLGGWYICPGRHPTNLPPTLHTYKIYALYTQLFSHVEGLGEILEVRVKIKPGAFRNFGFVRFANKDGAEKAVKELDKVRFYASCISLVFWEFGNSAGL